MSACATYSFCTIIFLEGTEIMKHITYKKTIILVCEAGKRELQPLPAELSKIYGLNEPESSFYYKSYTVTTKGNDTTLTGNILFTFKPKHFQMYKKYVAAY